MHAYTRPLDFIRHLRERHLDPIVDVDRVDVWIGAKLERNKQRITAVVAGDALHVDHLVDADDLRFDHLRNRGIDHLGGGSGIARRHRNLWGNDVGKLRDRNCEKRNQPGNRRHKRNDNGEPRPVDENR